MPGCVNAQGEMRGCCAPKPEKAPVSSWQGQGLGIIMEYNFLWTFFGNFLKKIKAAPCLMSQLYAMQRGNIYICTK